MEEDMRDEDNYSANIKDYLENSPFKVRSIFLQVTDSRTDGLLAYRKIRAGGDCTYQKIQR